MFGGRGVERFERGELGGDRMADGVVERAGVDGAEVEQRPHDVGARDAESVLRNESCEVSWAVNQHAIEVHVAPLLGDEHVDRVVVGAGDSPQTCRRPVRGDRSCAHCEHRCDDPLFGGVGRAVQAGHVGVDLLDRARLDGPVPGSAGEPRCLEGDDAVVAAGPVVEV